jgi:hypothetical protein
LTFDGIKIKNFYYLNENFLNQHSDEVLFKKIRLVLQHAVGYKSDKDKFIDEEITKYDIINFYDKTIPMTNVNSSVNHIFNLMIINTERGLCGAINDDFRDFTPVIYVNKIEENKFNPIKTEKIELNTKYLIKKFEAFNNFKFFL